MGYSATFLAVRALYRMVVERPPVLGGLVLAAGFATAAVTGAPRIDDAAAVAILRGEQRQRLRRALSGHAALPPVSPPGGGPAFWE